MTGDGQRDDLTRREEELRITTRSIDAGSVRVRKQIEVEHRREHIPRAAETFDGFEHAGANDADSGEIETLPDGSISIPILEEELVITKRLVVRERIIIRKTVTTEHQTVEADLQRERVTIEDDPSPTDDGQ